MTRKEYDIKAPDGFLLGGLRRVRKDGTILFQRGWWELPDEVKADFIGQDVWCHQEDVAPIDRGSDIILEVAHPGLHIYEARRLKMTVIADRNERPDAKPGVRAQWRKDWIARASKPSVEKCTACGEETHPDEAACLGCGHTKQWAQSAA